jgi:hypothetical protein
MFSPGRSDPLQLPAGLLRLFEHDHGISSRRDHRASHDPDGCSGGYRLPGDLSGPDRFQHPQANRLIRCGSGRIRCSHGKPIQRRAVKRRHVTCGGKVLGQRPPIRFSNAYLFFRQRRQVRQQPAQRFLHADGLSLNVHRLFLLLLQDPSPEVGR